jgi:hypothetical protein
MTTTVARAPLKRPPLVAVDDRISAAFKGGATSKDVTALIEEVEAAIIDTALAADKARHRAFDPVSTMNVVADARHEMDDAVFRHDRLNEVVKQLGQRLAELKFLEDDDQRRAAYDQVQEQRDQLAKELADTYPEAAQRIAELLGRIVANDTEIARVNLKTPSGRGPLLGAELAARRLKNFQASSPSIVRDTHLPDFTGTEYVWPQPRKFIYD